jgi:hypothetical protein
MLQIKRSRSYQISGRVANFFDILDLFKTDLSDFVEFGKDITYKVGQRTGQLPQSVFEATQAMVSEKLNSDP